MEDLRSEIRAAFESEQAAFAPPASLRPNLVGSAISRQRPRPNFEWMAVAAALMIAVLVVVGLMFSRSTNRSTATHPKTAPTAAPKVSGPPPAGLPVIYVRDSADPTIYFAVDWNGVPRGMIRFAQPPDDSRRLTQAPDGSAFLLPPFKGLAGAYYDRVGNSIATAQSPLDFFAWSDDSRHLCVLSDSAPGWAIDLLAPDGTRVSSHPVGLDPAIARSGAIAIEFQSCSPSNDRAVIVYNWFGQAAQVYLVRISDGAILLRRTYAANTLADVTASPDGSLIAEDSSKSSGYVGGPTAPYTVIRRTSNGTPVTLLDPTYGVLAFSADDSLALVNTSPSASGVPTHLALVRLSDKAVVWNYVGDLEFAGAMSQPNGSSIAVLLQQPSDSSTHPSVKLMILKSDGSSTMVPGQFVRP